MSSRQGRQPRWGEPTSAHTVRWPASHREVYEQRARARGMSFSEYVVRTMAELHDLELREETGNAQLPLTA